MRNILRETLAVAILLASYTLYADGQRTAKVTAYCSKCPDGGYSKSVAYKFKIGTCAADLRYHKRGSKVNIGGKWYTINNTGGAIKGRDRFDVCLGQPAKCKCNSFGVKRLAYYK